MDHGVGPRSNTIARAGCALFVVLMAVTIVLAFPVWQSSDWNTGVTDVVSQPVPFSHEHHVGGLGLDCRFCHTSVGKAASAGMPSADTCMNCHAQLYTNAELLEPVRRSWRDGEPIEWRRVHDLADFVYFNHSIHIAAQISCTRCHGHIEEMPLVWKAEPMTMQWCLGCHREPTDTTDRAAGIVPSLRPPPLDLSHADLALLTDCTACHR